MRNDRTRLETHPQARLGIIVATENRFERRVKCPSWSAPTTIEATLDLAAAGVHHG